MIMYERVDGSLSTPELVKQANQAVQLKFVNALTQNIMPVAGPNVL